ncbi:MAG: PilT/PilU family type 4a pilus ATPase [Acidobacteriota bacterium]|jgi:twitching motility protein PilT|nr:PilT/PilU family type 4a pilus ATPase [Acidobacteriota bacterium]
MATQNIPTEIKAKPSAFDRFNNVLKMMLEKEASDLHISVGSGFRIRILGQLVQAPDAAPLTPSEIASIAGGILLAGRKCTKENLVPFVESITDYDCSYSVPGLGRYRVNISSQRRSLALVLRHIPYVLPTIEGLGLPPVLGDIALSERGLVLVTGITGSGKSTTLASMINLINQNRQSKIVTIEDPIEFLYRDNKCSIAQRECGSDTESFAKALRAALRQDPDIILVGEMRDKETIDIAIKAAETGHLVLSTVHTTDAPRTISRILSVFDPSEQAATRLRLSETLLAVISQRLLQRADGTGRVAACEIMRQTKTIQECIAEPSKIYMLKEYIEKGREFYQMQTFDQHLTDLYRAGVINLETAKNAATSAADFERNLQFE